MNLILITTISAFLLFDIFFSFSQVQFFEIKNKKDNSHEEIAHLIEYFLIIEKDNKEIHMAVPSSVYNRYDVGQSAILKEYCGCITGIKYQKAII